MNDDFVRFFRYRYFVVNIFDNSFNISIKEKRFADRWETLKSYLLN